MNKVIKKIKNILNSTLCVIRYTINVTRYTLHVTQRGFSLVEMLVTIGMIAVLMIVSIPAFGKYGERQKLNEAAEEVASAIRETQNLSLAPNEYKPPAQDSYAFHCLNNTPGYVILCYKYDPISNQNILTNCSSQNTSSEYKPFILPGEEITFQSGCQIAGGTDNPDIFFQIPSGKIANPTNIEIVLINNKLSGNNTRTVKINRETGQVEIE